MLSQDNYQNAISKLDESNHNNTLLLLSLTFAMMYLINKFMHSRGRLRYKSSLASELAALIKVITDIWHASRYNQDICDYEGQVLAVGMHQTGFVDGAVVASSLKGIPPHIYATDAYDSIPGVFSFLKMFQAIKIKANAPRDKITGKSANDYAHIEAGAILKAGGSVALFPQGNMGKNGQPPHIVYPGAAKLAVDYGVAIRVIRIDGFWSLDNPLIPDFICNWRIYRALLTALHPNNVRVIDCGVIDFHLKKENEHLSYDDKIREILAQLYAYFHHEKRTPKQVHAIKDTISDKKHLLMWDKKDKREKLVKQIEELDKEIVNLKTPRLKPG